MASYCPHCGNPSPDEARFCMTCGRERLPVASAAPPVAAQPSPVAAQPSPVGAFFGRAFRGDWLSSAKAAAWPTGMLLALAVALAIPTYGQDDEVVVGWSDRLRIALAMLLQGFGGGFEVKAADGSPGGLYGDGGGFPGSSGSSGPGSSDYGDAGTDAIGAASLSLVPLTVTLLMVGALYLGARTLRTKGAGLEAAVRISLLVTGVVLVLGLFAQPEIEGMRISSSPLLAALGTLAISLAVTSGVLQRDDLAGWLAQRPAARSTVRALGTAVGALGVVVALCSVVGFIVYATADDVDGTALLVVLPVLPNIGFAVLGLSWGVPVEYDVQGRSGMGGSSTEHGSFGLGEISDVWGGGAVAGALALGVICALTLGIRAARRSADRREQLLAGGFSLGLVLLFLGVSGVSADLAGGMGDWGGQGTSEFAPSVADGLLFGLLWVGAATFLGPYVLRMVGQQSAPPALPAVLPVHPGYGPVPGYVPG
ncbi:zinc ribbon domain-containing protein, partial [Streptomyces lunaelactis]|uniref:zinc ribbon domain-containing protein n=1 Tax=Streptomyces lunaelactis TaxID=1535768 RepID=UPI0015845A35|nr:zinc ribbon domain-containing protein [Streptomyces lunaelactis]